MTQQIGKYELVKALGAGASGTVYLATDTFTGEPVALKVLDPAIIADPDFEKTRRKQFLIEASLAGKLSHPHIADILEASVNDNEGYIAFEYIAGGNLLQFVSADNLLPVQDAIEIAFKCCGALDYASRQGIVHRDLKPANIMVVEGTNIKVADFGAAYLHRAMDTQVSDIGSPLYMSPEQITGRELTYHSDMFALGVVFYELLTGHRPFVADTLLELFDSILNRDPLPPSTLRPGVSAQVDAILLRMLRKAPEDRYASWADLALDLADAGRLSTFAQAIPDSVKFVALRKIAMLDELDDAEIWELVHAGQWRRAPSQSIIMREDEPGDSIFFLASGSVKVTKLGRLLNVVNAGEYFGEMAYVKGGTIPRQATVESITELLLAEFPTASLGKLSQNSQFRFALVLLHTLVDRLVFADQRIARAVS